MVIQMEGKRKEQAWGKEGDSAGSVPPPKKRRGQNKHRPRSKVPFSEQLCPMLSVGRECKFGTEKCRYTHNVAEYMRLKPPDLGNRCVLFDKYGKCPYGLACRFGSCHITPDHQNVTRKDARASPCNPNSPRR